MREPSGDPPVVDLHGGQDDDDDDDDDGAGVKAQFFQHGFLKITGFLEPYELEALAGPYSRVMNDALTTRVGSRVPARKPSFVYILQPELRSPDFGSSAILHEIFERAKVIASTVHGLAPSDLHVTSSVFFKPAFHGRAIPWHQDAFYEQKSIMSFWFSFDVCTRENGALRYIPGSHERGLLPHALNTDDPGRSSFMIKDVDDSQSVVCDAEPGDLLVHHPKMLHSSGPNTTGSPRAALVLRCKPRS